jgi:hypothetical protein
MKYLIILSLIVASCTKQEKQNDVCNCYEYHEKFDVIYEPGAWGQIDWRFHYETTPGLDICEKDNGEWIYYGNQGQYRYRTICN